MKETYIIRTQYREWYGNGELTEGRYKNKGGDDFIIELDPQEAYNVDELRKKWNEQHNRLGEQYGCWEFLDIEYYYKPSEAKLVDGKFEILYRTSPGRG